METSCNSFSVRTHALATPARRPRSRSSGFARCWRRKRPRAPLCTALVYVYHTYCTCIPSSPSVSYISLQDPRTPLDHPYIIHDLRACHRSVPLHHVAHQYTPPCTLPCFDQRADAQHWLHVKAWVAASVALLCKSTPGYYYYYCSY